MHFEILVEDQSGKKALEILVPKIIGEIHSFRVHAYKGIGRIPQGLKQAADPSKRILLDNLPRLLQGYGKTYAGNPSDYAVILVCDLDDKCMKIFRQELFRILNSCHPCPETRFCIAVEEGEAWFLGDVHAIKSAYPNAKNDVLHQYVNDSICGTWEKLADALYPGGAVKLARQGFQVVGAEKSKWAEMIAQHMNIDDNKSPSFRYFTKKLRDLAGG